MSWSEGIQCYRCHFLVRCCNFHLILCILFWLIEHVNLLERPEPIKVVRMHLRFNWLNFYALGGMTTTLQDQMTSKISQSFAQCPANYQKKRSNWKKGISLFTDVASFGWGGGGSNHQEWWVCVCTFLHSHRCPCTCRGQDFHHPRLLTWCWPQTLRLSSHLMVKVVTKNWEELGSSIFLLAASTGWAPNRAECASSCARNCAHNPSNPQSLLCLLGAVAKDLLSAMMKKKKRQQCEEAEMQQQQQKRHANMLTFLHRCSLKQLKSPLQQASWRMRSEIPSAPLRSLLLQLSKLDSCSWWLWSLKSVAEQSMCSWVP